MELPEVGAAQHENEQREVIARNRCAVDPLTESTVAPPTGWFAMLPLGCSVLVQEQRHIAATAGTQ